MAQTELRAARPSLLRSLAQTYDEAAPPSITCCPTGSTQALVDDGGTVTTRYDYTPYGQTSVTAVTGGHVDQPLRYTGQHQDPTGLYKMGLRYYNPTQARWTQPDPALSLTALPFANTYAYVANNPINGTDSTGALTLSEAVGYASSAVQGCATFGAAGGLSLVTLGAALGVSVSSGGAYLAGCAVGAAVQVAASVATS